jgi:hypothetical protein
VVRIGGVADDALVLFVEGVHRAPGERDPVAQRAGVFGEDGLAPGGVRGFLVAGRDGEPGRVAEVPVPGRLLRSGRFLDRTSHRPGAGTGQHRGHGDRVVVAAALTDPLDGPGRQFTARDRQGCVCLSR